MKKVFKALLALVLCLSLCTCAAGNPGGKNGAVSPATVQHISLTPDNIDDYIHISGYYTESEYHKTFFHYTSSSVIDFEACATSEGFFDNVEITVRAHIGNPGNADGNWHLADIDTKDLTFSFKMPASGDFSHSYAIECERSTQVLTGSCQFTVVSVSGFFIPEE